ncbi:DUF6844 domain-containing protein [Cysteiniphilum sp. 6C5]|uniref:DUF6844 domain-containing protein n=1 Tax=unclassified Cysteiniphilum TaxID=2610889 RepID=UPI003F84E819
MKLKAIAATLFMVAGINVYAAQQNQVTTDVGASGAKTPAKVEKTSVEGTINQAAAKDTAISEKVGQDDRTAQEVIMDKVGAYIASNGLNFNNEDTRVYSAYAKVAKSDNDNNVMNATTLQLAFQEAMLKAQAELVNSVVSKNLTKIVFENHQDDSSNKYDIDNDQLPGGGDGFWSTMSSLYHKYIAIKSNDLDKQLAKQGVDAEKIAQDPMLKKQVAFQKMLIEAYKNAYLEVAGLLPLKTFVVTKDNQQYVAVIALYSEKIRTLVTDVKSGKASSIHYQKGLSINEVVNKSANVLKNDFGIRIVFDERGEPVILSYAQFAYQRRGSANSLDIAVAQARAVAEANYANFLNSSMTTSQLTKLGRESAEYVFRNLTTDKENIKSTNNLINMLDNEIKNTASTSLSGVQVAKTWRYIQKGNNDAIYGVVLAWSPTSMRLAQKVKDFNANTYNQAQQKHNTDKTNVVNKQNKQSNKAIVSESEDNPYLHQF